jgi:hypothetical protein
VAYDLFICFIYLPYVSILLSRPRNSKQWLEYQQCWENQSYRIVGIGDLHTISLINVYKRLIHAAIQ